MIIIAERLMFYYIWTQSWRWSPVHSMNAAQWRFEDIKAQLPGYKNTWILHVVWPVV